MDRDYQVSSSSVVSIVLSMLGLVLVGFGIFALVGAILAAWNLYSHPEGIGYFANYVLETAKFAAEREIAGLGLAHSLAWVIVVLLLLVLGKLGAWAVISGARLFSWIRTDRD